MKTKPSLDELIEREARKLATDKLEHELSARNLPLPKETALDLHVTQILTNSPEIWETARAHVEAQTDAYSEGLRVLGLLPKALNLDISL